MNRQDKIYKDLKEIKIKNSKYNKTIYRFAKKINHQSTQKKKQKVQMNLKQESKKEVKLNGRYPLEYKLS